MSEMQNALVLVVHDSSTRPGQLAADIRNFGYRVNEVFGKACAFQHMRESDHDLVILDIGLSGMVGFETLKELKADSSLREVPVIVVFSLDADDGAVAQAMNLGAEDFFLETCTAPVLQARVRCTIDRMKARDLDFAYRRDVERLIEAAQIIEAGEFRPAELGLLGVSARKDPLGRLAHVFGHLAEQVYNSEQRRDIALRTLRGTLLVLAAGAFFGLAPAIGRVSSGIGLPPLGVVFWANLVAALACLGVTLVRSGVPRLTREDLKFVAAWAIVLGCLYQPLTAIVAVHVEATMIALVGSTRGFMVFLLAALFALESANLRRFLGLGIGFAAVAAVFSAYVSSAEGAPPAWMLAALALPALLALHTLLMSWRRTTLPASAAVGLMMALSALLLLPVTVGTNTLVIPWKSPSAALVVILALGLSTAVALVLALELVSLTGPVFASQMAYSQTLAGIAWGALLVDESLSPLSLLALAIVIGGFWLVAPRSAGGDFRATLPTVKPAEGF